MAKVTSQEVGREEMCDVREESYAFGPHIVQACSDTAPVPVLPQQEDSQKQAQVRKALIHEPRKVTAHPASREGENAKIHISRETKTYNGYIHALTMCKDDVWPFITVRLNKVDCQKCRREYIKWRDQERSGGK